MLECTQYIHASQSGDIVFLSIFLTITLRCVHTHMTRSQNEQDVRSAIKDITCHNMVIRNWNITTIPKGLSETLFGRF